MHSWGKLWTRYKETKTPTTTSEELREGKHRVGVKAGYCTCPRHIPPPKWWANLSHPSGPTRGHTLTLTPYKEPARPPSASKQAREPVAYFRFLVLQQGPPIKLCLNFLSGLSSISID